jgi:replicative DNA helicase
VPEVPSRRPPRLSDPAAERAVLAGVFQHGAAGFAEVSDVLGPEGFTVDSNAVIWKCLSHFLKDGGEYQPDVPSVLSAAKSVGLGDFFDDPDEKSHLRAVQSLPVEFSNLRNFASKVRKLQLARDLADELDRAKSELERLTGDETPAQIIGIAENRVADFNLRASSTDDSDPTPLGAGLKEYLRHVRENPVTQIGLSSGFRRYDEAIGGGFRKGTVNVIAARAKQGKSTMAESVALHVAGKLGFPVLNLDNEMVRQDHWHRATACLSGQSMKSIETGRYTDIEAVEAAADTIAAMPYEYRNVSAQSFEETLATMRRWVLRRVGLGDDGLANNCLIIYDQIKLIDSAALSRNLAEHQVIGFMATQLHAFAVKYGVPILTFVQLNRDGISVEDSSAVSQSDRISWLASNVSIYKAQAEEEIAEQPTGGTKYNRKLVPILCRHGPGLELGDFIHVGLKKETFHLTEGPTRFELMRAKPASGFVTDGASKVEF